METTLDLDLMRKAMRDLGLNQSQLASKLDVSRAAVTKWFRGEDFPRPDRLLKLGMLLGLSFGQLVTERPGAMEPVVAFRRKGMRKTTETHVMRARHMGTLLGALAPLLPFDSLARPATLREPVNEYAYLQRVARRIREEIGVAQDGPLQFRDLVDHFASLNTVLIPVLWGHKEHHENALHIYLPQSMTTWVYLNLDSHVHDFKFWMAHELGHVHAPDLRDDDAEDFADGFAQALIFPEPCAANAYGIIGRAKSERARINRIKDVARTYGVSPTTVDLALHAYEHENELATVSVGRAIHAASTNFNKDFPSASETLFREIPPTPREYVQVAREEFRTPFFNALRRHLREVNDSSGFVQTVLQLPLLDAKGIVEELR